MQCCPAVEPRAIRRHYDLATVFYRLLWGPHIHHGFWYANESARVAQLNLIERLADACGVGEGDRMLDVGCGMGGSSIHLARTRHCHVNGITISLVQRRWASLAAHWHRVGDRTVFTCRDAESCELPTAAFDVVWSVECTEHLFQKPRFFQRAAEWLKPGGRLAICAWLAGSATDDLQQQRQVADVCDAFLCPSLGTHDDYCQWIRDSGLELVQTADWTESVIRTWELCRQRVELSRVRWLAGLVDPGMVSFLDHFETLRQAYATGAMRYGCFVARKLATR